MYLAYGDAGQESCDKLLSNQLVVDPTLPKAPLPGQEWSSTSPVVPLCHPLSMSRLVGLQAPDFSATAVVDQEFKEITLSHYRGKFVVLFFYPLDFTFVCPTEITAFSDRYSDFSSRNCEVLGVSVDSQFSHLAWVQTDRKNGGLGDIAYPLLADLKKDIARAYEVLDEEAGVALRGLFIIDPDGVIMQSTINNLPVGRSVDETLRLLQAFQHIRSNPDEVCPANWTPGEKTMNPDPIKSKEFFAAVN